jgi:hypothetical protein
MKKSLIFTGVLFLSLLLASCQPAKPGTALETPEPLPTETMAVTNTPEATNTTQPTETPAPTNTELPPTATFTETVTPSPIPSPTLKLEVYMTIYNYCRVPVNIKIEGPLSFNLNLQTAERVILNVPIGTYSFWNDKNGERIQAMITGTKFLLCTCGPGCEL